MFEPRHWPIFVDIRQNFQPRMTRVGATIKSQDTRRGWGALTVVKKIKVKFTKPPIIRQQSRIFIESGPEFHHLILNNETSKVIWSKFE